MRRPSSRILDKTISFARFDGPVPQDADGGAAPDYATTIATAVPCSVQALEIERVVSQQRVTTVITYAILLGDPLALAVNDVGTWVDDLGVTRTLIVAGVTNPGGHGGEWTVLAMERR
jgi:hypothetical protein